MRKTFIDESYREIEKITERIYHLAGIYHKNHSLFSSEMFWINTNRAIRTYEFGKKLGELNESNELFEVIINLFHNTIQHLESIYYTEYIKIFFEGNLSLIDGYYEGYIETKNSISIDFLAGYLHSLYMRDEKQYESIIRCGIINIYLLLTFICF